MKNNLTQKYSRGTIIIHWLSALLLVIIFTTGIYMTKLPTVEKSGFLKIHAGFGILVFILTLSRCFITVRNKTPKVDTSYKWNNIIMKTIHYGFYVLIIGICITGILVMNRGEFGEVLSQNNYNLINYKELGVLKAHSFLAGLLILLFILHVGGISKHILLTKENIIRRII